MRECRNKVKEKTANIVLILNHGFDALLLLIPLLKNILCAINTQFVPHLTNIEKELAKALKKENK